MQWDYDSSAWTYSYGDSKTTLGPDAYYGSDSTWYSSSLYSDGSETGTSYDYTYSNRYSYNSDTMDVMQWDYDSSAWTYSYGDSKTTLGPDAEVTIMKEPEVSTPVTIPSEVTSSNPYTGSDSTWYSSSLYSDGSGTSTSYDYSYSNSYSYSVTGDVM